MLYIYLSVSEHTTNSILLKEVDGEQRSIYFVRKTFMDCQIRYLPLEKLVLALVLTSWKLMPYFEEHPIAMYTKFSLKNILSKVDLSGQLSKLVVELEQLDIKILAKGSNKRTSLG